MSENQLGLNENRRKYLEKLFEALSADLPVVAKGIGELGDAAYEDGALSAKTKRLMSMALALGVGCRNCVLAQAKHALEKGATRPEFLEAISVVLSMRGTTGVAESLRVVQLLDELGKW